VAIAATTAIVAVAQSACVCFFLSYCYIVTITDACTLQQALDKPCSSSTNMTRKYNAVKRSIKSLVYATNEHITIAQVYADSCCMYTIVARICCVAATFSTHRIYSASTSK
jgi:hypothetical protein